MSSLNKNMVSYRKSLKKQIVFVLIWLLTVIVLGVNLYPVNTSPKAIVFGVLTLCMGVVVLLIMRRAAKEAICPYCKAELYVMIENAKRTKVQFNFCPSCGKNISI